MIVRTAALGLVLAAVAAHSVAQVNRWVDERGQVHYGDRALSTNMTTLRIRSESATSPAGVEASRAAPVKPAVAASAPARPGSTPHVAPVRPRATDAPRT